MSSTTRNILFGLSLLSLGSLSSHLWLFYSIYFLIGVVGSGTTPVPYAKVITRWFDRRRGLALGLSVTASYLSFALMPSLAQALIAAMDWRGAHLVIGFMVLGIAIPVVALLGAVVWATNHRYGIRCDGILRADPGHTRCQHYCGGRLGVEDGSLSRAIAVCVELLIITKLSNAAPIIAMPVAIPGRSGNHLIKVEIGEM